MTEKIKVRMRQGMSEGLLVAMKKSRQCEPLYTLEDFFTDSTELSRERVFHQSCVLEKDWEASTPTACRSCAYSDDFVLVYPPNSRKVEVRDGEFSVSPGTIRLRKAQPFSE